MLPYMKGESMEQGNCKVVGFLKLATGLGDLKAIALLKTIE